MWKAYLSFFIQSVSQTKKEVGLIDDRFLQVFSGLKNVKDQAILELVERLKNDTTPIQVTDFGAGSKRQNGNSRRLCDLVKSASIPPKYGRFLNQCIDIFDLKHGVELGTSLGIGSLYLTWNQPGFYLQTMEGCPEIAKQAQKHFNQLKQTNILPLVGEFSTQFSQIKDMQDVDFVYVDGNHTKQATLAYFEFFKSKIKSEAILVFDDIYWSQGMYEAWKIIQSDPQVVWSLDLMRMGLIRLKKGDGQPSKHLCYHLKSRY